MSHYEENPLLTVVAVSLLKERLAPIARAPRNSPKNSQATVIRSALNSVSRGLKDGELALVIEVFPVPLEAAESGMLAELLGCAVPIIVGEELDLAPVVVFESFGGRDDREKFPVGVMDRVF